MPRDDVFSTRDMTDTASLDDLRRRLRFGMGPCQGGYCALRAAGVSVETGHRDAASATEALGEFLSNRWLGLWPILAGDQVRQAALDNWIWRGTLDLEHALPSASICSSNVGQTSEWSKLDS